MVFQKLKNTCIYNGHRHHLLPYLLTKFNFYFIL